MPGVENVIEPTSANAGTLIRKKRGKEISNGTPPTVKKIGRAKSYIGKNKNKLYMITTDISVLVAEKADPSFYP